MKIKCFAMLITFCMLVALASAQPYSIRANRELNLRAEPSLDAEIAETIRSGALLQVVGKFNRWLKIDRNGREVWLADWVDFSRVDDSSEPTGSQQPTSPIDNCCGIDRQCQSDQEWIDGYWAYQNNQCPAPPQPQPVTPAQPVASAPATVDNCCYVDRQCASEAQWEAGYWAFQNNQCPVSAKPTVLTPSRPRIEGSEAFVSKFTATLNLLQQNAPPWYDYVNRYVDLIRAVPDSDPTCQSSVAFVHYEAARNVYFEACLAGLDSDRLAGALVHEACHRRHRDHNISYPGGIWEEELECMKAGGAVARALDPAWRDHGSFLDVDFVIARLRATNCFAKINTYEEFYSVLDIFWDGGGADYTC